LSLLDAIREVADDLSEPHQHTERIRIWDGNRNPKYRTHTTTQPGLLRQLWECVHPAGTVAEGSIGGSFGSRPPLALEALSRHTVIGIAVLRWCRSLDLKVRKSVESNIRALVGAAGALDDDTARLLLAEMRQWRRWAAVLTGWEKVLTLYRVPCPVCEQPGTLRINLTNATAMCRHCSSTWADDDGSIQVLARHVESYTSAAV
jgi:hypothetical protein